VAVAKGSRHSYTKQTAAKLSAQLNPKAVFSGLYISRDGLPHEPKPFATATMLTGQLLEKYLF
jgi:hypothetical protein